MFKWLTITFFMIQVAAADEPLKPMLTPTLPVIDGSLDDVTWQTAPFVKNFKTFYPDYGIAIAETTRAYYAYDHENLYFAFRCEETEPDKIKTSITSRDQIYEDDWVCINLDTFNDQQTLYAFYVNPSGIQGDSRFITGQEDRNIDLVWYCAGQVDSSGYTVEIQIPTKSIRFSNKNPVTMAIIFERFISRRVEHSSFPEFSSEVGLSGFLTQMFPISYHDLQQSKVFELLPAVTYSQHHDIDAGKLTLADHRGDFSLTAKYGITSDLVIDATYNPDFSQIEADAGQVDINLRYDLYFPEKRPFFLEGKENFRIAATAASELDPIRSIIHTRMIIDPITGIRLTGKIGNRNTLALLYAADEIQNADVANTPEADKYIQYPILRYKRSLRDDSYIGGIATARESADNFNRVLGIDGLSRVNKSSTFEYHGLFSRTKEKTSAAKEGSAIGLRFHYETRDLDYDLSLLDISNDFRADMGYIERTGIFQASGLLRPKLYPQINFCQRIDPELFTAQSRDKFHHRWETFNHLSFLFYIWGNSQFKVKYSYATEIYNGEKFQTGGFHVLLSGYVTKKFAYGILYRRIKAIYYAAAPYQGESNRLTMSAAYQPSDKLNFEMDFTYFDFYRETDQQKIYDYPITRAKLTYQLNKYLFLRGIVEYNAYKEEMLTDLLASFTYIPGTVIHFGYGSIFNKITWQTDRYIDSDRFMETKRGFFFKTSFLWRN